MFDFSNVTVQGIKDEVDAAVSRAEAIAGSVSDPATPSTYDAVMAPLDEIIDLMRATSHHTQFMKQVHPNPAVREAGNEATEVLTRWWQFPESPWSVELAFRPEINAAVERFARTEEAAGLTGERKRFLDSVIADLRLVGHHLEPDDQARLRELSDRLIVLSTRFSKAIAADTSHLFIGDDDLDGLPESYVGALTKDEETGSYKVTMAYPDYVPFM